MASAILHHFHQDHGLANAGRRRVPLEKRDMLQFRSKPSRRDYHTGSRAMTRILGAALQVIGALSLSVGLVAIPCGLLGHVIPYPPLFYSEWYEQSLILLLMSPLLLVPSAVLCIYIGKQIGQPTLLHNRCPYCGYDLRTIVARGCPECGWNRPPNEGQRPRQAEPSSTEVPSSPGSTRTESPPNAPPPSPPLCP